MTKKTAKNIIKLEIITVLIFLINKINNSRFTRIPFWQNNQENIIGLLDKRILNIDINKDLDNKNIIFEIWIQL